MIIILKKVPKTLAFNKNDLDIIHELWKSWFYKLCQPQRFEILLEILIKYYFVLYI